MNYRQFFTPANYQHVSNPAYKGNPFIEHLGEFPDDKTIASKLTVLPSFEPGMRELPKNQRVELLSNISTTCVPLPRLVDLARSVLKLMREGYRPRRPYSLEDNAIVRSLFTAQETGVYVPPIPRPTRVDLARQLSMAVRGSSGCGKSFSLSRISGLFDNVVYHEAYGKWQLPILFVEMAYDGASTHTLATSLFDELTRRLPDSRYDEIYSASTRLNAESRLAKALALCYEHGVGAIVIDEAQNKSENPRRTWSKESRLVKLLVTASNTSHIPLVFSGTMELHGGNAARFTRLRRMAGNGSVDWLPLERSNSLKAPGEFEMVLLALWRYQLVAKPVAPTDTWAQLFWDCTQGIPDIMVKLWDQAQEIAITRGYDTLTPELVISACAERLGSVGIALKALQSDNKTVLSAMPDLYDPAIQSLASKAKRAAKKSYTGPNPIELKSETLPDLRSLGAPLHGSVIQGSVLM